jgi:hypothetical protein
MIFNKQAGDKLLARRITFNFVMETSGSLGKESSVLK